MAAAGDFYEACAAGDADAVRDCLALDGGLAGRKGGPDHREPILYSCYSPLLRRDPSRAAAIRQAVRMLLDNGADPNVHFLSDPADAQSVQTPLFGAAGIANDAELTRLLLAAGADVDEGLRSPDEGGALGSEALYHAAEFADVACLRMLLEARPHAARVSYCLGRAVDFAAPGAAMAFLDHGADPNFRIPWNRSRSHLHKAAICGRAVALISKMIKRGADVNAADADGVSAYRFAVRFGHADLARLLREGGASADGVTEDDRRLGACAAGTAAGGPIGDRAAAADVLCRAAQLGDVAAVGRLLDAGVDVDGRGNRDDAPALTAACWRGQLEAARLLIGRGASLTLVNGYGGTALGAAVHGSEFCHDVEGGTTMRPADEVGPGRYPELVEMLIAAGARPPAEARCGGAAVRAVLRRHGARG